MSAPFNSAEAACRAALPPTKGPPVDPATRGPSIAKEANAGLSYQIAGAGEKVLGSDTTCPNTGPPHNRRASGRVSFRASTGALWAYTGKRGRVLEMMAKDAGGVTQWDCYPWHTRLGASIHAMRRDGLMIETQREGEYRHARYRLSTPGRLLTRVETGDDPEIQA